MTSMRLPRLRMVTSFALASIVACVPGAERGGSSEPIQGYGHVPVAGPVATAEERAACEAAGGAIAVAGLLGHEACILTLADGGKACTDSDDCIGRCRNSGAFVDAGEPVAAGFCEWSNSPFGCWQEVVDGRGGLAICVD